MSPEISSAQMAVYRATARQRRVQKAQALALRRQRAWEVARQAARTLKEQFGARRVAVFGSVSSAQRFHQRSDVDLAVWGLDEKAYYRAVSRLLDVDPAIPIDLVEMELAPSNLRHIIEQEGVLL